MARFQFFRDTAVTSVIWRSLGFVMDSSGRESFQSLVAGERQRNMVGNSDGDQMKTLLFALALVISSGIAQAQSLARKYRHLFATARA